jgi:hypothetical protein
MLPRYSVEYAHDRQVLGLGLRGFPPFGRPDKVNLWRRLPLDGVTHESVDRVDELCHEAAILIPEAAFRFGIDLYWLAPAYALPRGGRESDDVLGCLGQALNQGEDETRRRCHVPPQEIHEIKSKVDFQIDVEFLPVFIE